MPLAALLAKLRPHLRAWQRLGRGAERAAAARSHAEPEATWLPDQDTPVPGDATATAAAHSGHHRQALLLWGGGLLAVLCAWLALYLGSLAAAHQRQTRVADAVAAVLTRPDGAAVAPAELGALARQLAQAHGAELRLVDGKGRILAVQPMAKTRALPDLALAHWLAHGGAPSQRLVSWGADTANLYLRAPVDDLWDLHLQAAAWLWALAAATAAVAWLLRRQGQQRLSSAVAATLGQARHLGEVGYVAPSLVAQPELQPLVLAMDQLHQRLRALFGVHAEQIEALRRQAHLDPLTSLPNRRHFLAVLDAVLGGDSAPTGAGLLVLRLVDLQSVNQRLGAGPTDKLLRTLAEVLISYPQRNGACAVGRLTGGDFGLLLPTGGVAHETGQSLLQGLRAQLARIDPQARLVMGAVELHPPLGSAQALAMALAALTSGEQTRQAASSPGGLIWPAGTEPTGPAAPDHHRPTGPAAAAPPAPLPAALSPPVGAAAAAVGSAAAADAASWQRRLGRAVVQGQVRLAEFPVKGPDGGLVMLDCPLRVQLSADGPYEPAVRWLAQATRSRLHAAVDEKAVALALRAIADDGVPRCVNISAASALSVDLLDAVERRLAAQPEAAAHLWLDLPESLALDSPAAVQRVAQRWRPWGARLALEHCGEALMRVPRLIDLGLDCVRIDGRFVNGIAQPQAGPARDYLRGLVRVVQSVGLSVTAEGVREAEDLVLLWRMGFDAATGPAVSPVPQAAPEPA